MDTEKEELKKGPLSPDRLHKEKDGTISLRERTVPSHVFIELTSLDELSFPTSSSTRIRYTCLSASPHYLAVGSTSGTVYLFSRYAAKYRKSLSSVPVQVIACKEGSVQHVSSSPNEKYLAVGTSRGHVSIVSLIGNYPSVVLNNTAHVGQAVSCLAWTDDSSRLYVGDTAGRVSCSRVGNRNILRAASELVLELDSSIVQLDFAVYHLLISSMSRCYLYHISRGTCAQVGRKLRSGPYGGCFFPSVDSEHPIIFAGRPSGRLWEVDGDGVVYSTHQFNSLTTAPSLPLITFRKNFDAGEHGIAKNTISFEKIHTVSCDFLLTVNGSSLCVVDPKRARIVMICEFGEDVLQYAVCGSDVFVLTCHDGALRKLSLLSLPKAVEKLHWRECYPQAAQIMTAYQHLLPKLPWNLALIENVSMHLKNDTPENASIVESLFTDVNKLLLRARKEAASEHKSNVVRSSAIRLPTGVHRVLKTMENSGYDDDFTFRAPSPFRSPPLKFRSCSSPAVDQSGQGDLDYQDTGGKRMSLPAPESLMTGSRSEDSFLFLKDQDPTTRQEQMEASRSHRVTKSVVPSTERVEVKPLIGTPETIEEKMLRSLEIGGTKVLDSVEKMADALVNFSMLPNTKPHQKLGGTPRRGSGLTRDISYPKPASMSAEHYSAADYWSKPKEPPTPATPLKPMPEVPSVIQVTRTGKNKAGVVKRKKHHRHAERTDSAASANSPQAEKRTESIKTTKDEDMNNYSDKQPRITTTSYSSDIQQAKYLNGNLVNPSEKSEYFRSPTKSFSENNFIPPVPEMTEAVKNDENFTKDARNCPRCGMHKSWLTVLRMGSYLSDISISSEEVLTGGVPSSATDWMELLSQRCGKDTENNVGKDKSLCHSCLSAFDLLRGRAMQEELDDSTRKHPADLKAKAVLKLCGKRPVEDFKRVALGKRLPSTEQLHKVPSSVGLGPMKFKLNTTEEMAYSTYMNPVYDSSGDGEISPDDHSPWSRSTKKQWPWLKRAPLSGLLTAMAYVLGLKTVLDTIRRNEWLKKSVTDDVWLCLGRLSGGRRDLSLPNDILETFLKDSLGQTESEKVLSWMEEKGTKSESLVIDATQNCPCCTLPLEAKVLRVAIIGFPCGHAFHMICLKNQTMKSRDSETFQCIKCSYLAANVATV